MIVQSRVQGQWPYNKLADTLVSGKTSKGNLFPRAGKRLYAISPSKVLLLLAFVFCSGLAIQFTTGIVIFFKRIFTPGNAKQSTMSLKAYLNFSDKTTLNFMHFHKTGGVSFKIALFAFFKGKRKRNEELVKCRDSCYKTKPPLQKWRCDWHPVWAMNETQRNNLDVIFGHQFWVHGAQDFLTKRDLRTFTVIRHPFDRKVSFFFHFMVREAKRNERSISFDEVRDFLLYDKLRQNIKFGRDVGPNYVAGRLLSDGRQGYVGSYQMGHYDVKEGQEEQIAEKALKILRKYVFIGMQSESPASKCMLRKTIEAFNAAHGIDNTGTEKVAEKIPVANSGSYTLTAPKIWERLSKKEKTLFNKKEQVDLAIYYEGARMFQKHVRRFNCDHLLKKRRYDYRD